MNPKELDLINKSLVSELSETEKEALDQWKQNEANNSLYKLVEDIQLDESIEHEAENMRSTILDDIHRRMDDGKRRIARIRNISVAASIALLIGLSGFFLYQNTFSPESRLITRSNTSDTQTEIVLPDGSTVILHGRSTISFPAAFSEKSRQVQLSGEAYFNVRKDEQAPFMVQSGEISIKVLGTTFNVEAYDEDNLIRVTLETGKISMSTEDYKDGLILTPNQQAVYDKQNKSILKRNVNAEEVIGWTKNRLYFNSMLLEDIVLKLERHFNVEIETSLKKLKDIPYTGEFVEDESIDEILTVLSMMDNRINYEYRDNKIVVYE